MTREPDIACVPEGRCLDCGHKINTVGTSDPAGEARPQSGDVTVCIKCGAVMKLDQDLRLRGFTDEEMDEVTRNRDFMDGLASMVRAVHFVRHMAG